MNKQFTNTILFALSIVFTLIGIHQAMQVGFHASYSFFMIAIALFFWYLMRKGPRQPDNKADSEQKSKPETPWYLRKKK